VGVALVVCDGVAEDGYGDGAVEEGLVPHGLAPRYSLELGVC
jgi:hypothetical protein